MSTKKYHKEVYFEGGATERFMASLASNIRVGQEQLTYSMHAKLETIKDRYQIIPVLRPSDLKAEDIIEYTKENGAIVKALFRISTLSLRFDFSYSVSVDGRVLTCWANTKDDRHRTLNKNLYEGELNSGK